MMISRICPGFARNVFTWSRLLGATCALLLADTRLTAEDFAVFRANLNGVGSGSGGAADLIELGGTGALQTGANGNTVVLSSASPFTAGSGSYVRFTRVVGGTTGSRLLVTPASADTSWGRIFKLIGGQWQVNGALDFFWRPAQTPGAVNAIRPLDLSNSPNGLRIVLYNTNATTLQTAIITPAGGGGVAMNATYSPGFTANQIYHVGLTFSTNPSTAVTTMKMFVVAGTGAINTATDTNLVGSATFTLDPSIVSNTTGWLATETWKFGDILSVSETTTNDYDRISLYSQDPGTFAALTNTSPASQPEEPSIVVMPLGDSITRGIGGNKAGYREPLYRLLTGAGYRISYVGSETLDSTAFLADTGNAYHEGHGGFTISQIDAGLDGETTGWLTGVPGTRDPVYPDVILLMAGTNDLAVTSGAVALSRMDALLNKLSALRPSALIIVSTVVPYTYGSNAAVREQRNLDFNAGLPAMVASHRAAGQRVWLFDVRTRINSTMGGMSSDGLHPTQTGYNAMADGWFETFRTLPRIEAWRHAKFGTASATGVAADEADPDSDGRSNLLEYALGGEPTFNDAVSIAPTSATVTVDDGEYLALTFMKRRYAELDYIVETTSDLTSALWQTDAVQQGGTMSINDDFEQVTWRDAMPLASHPSRFMRLRVSLR